MKHLTFVLGSALFLSACMVVTTGTNSMSEIASSDHIGEIASSSLTNGKNGWENLYDQLSGLGRMNCGRYEMDIYFPKSVSIAAMSAEAQSSTTALYSIRWTIHVTSKQIDRDILVQLPVAWDGSEWYAERLSSDGVWEVVDKPVPLAGHVQDTNVVHRLTPDQVNGDIVLAGGSLHRFLNHAFYNGVTPGHYRIHFGEYITQLDGEQACRYNQGFWEIEFKP